MLRMSGQVTIPVIGSDRLVWLALLGSLQQLPLNLIVNFVSR
jgi:hypothetical protein